MIDRFRIAATFGTHPYLRGLGGIRTFRQLQDAAQLTPGHTRCFARAAATEVMALRSLGLDAVTEALTLLCEIATLEDEALATEGMKALFSMVVEPLADFFTPQDCATYYAVFGNVIEFCRRLPAGRDLNARLNAFGLKTEHEVYHRIQRITQPKTFDRAQADRVKKAFIVSRITIGADVEITSLIWQKLQQVFPSAEIILLGGRQAREIFGGDPRLRFAPIGYYRGGGLIERLSTWLTAVDTLERLTRGFAQEEFILLDPDSRLTQLGMLPLMRDEASYYFFESRGFQRPGASSLSQLTVRWLDEVFGRDKPLQPRVSLKSKYGVFAKALVDKIRQRTARPVVSLNFGIGENPKKRLPDPFEQQLVLRLVRDGNIVVLDKGVGEDEAKCIDTIRLAIELHGVRVIGINEQNASTWLAIDDLHAEVFTWQGSLGQFSAMIEETDCYIGYDSAGQHIAAALGIPTVVVFAGYSSEVFIQRWRPSSRGHVKVVPVDTLCLGDHIDHERIVEQIMYAVHSL